MPVWPAALKRLDTGGLPLSFPSQTNTHKQTLTDNPAGAIMTGLSRSTHGLEPRRKRLLFRAWHRGTREMDLLMGTYAESVIETLSEDELTIFEALIEVPDRDLFSWIAQGEAVPSNYDTPVFHALKAFHTHDKPIEF
jgi:antitoxin CptB